MFISGWTRVQYIMETHSCLAHTPGRQLSWNVRRYHPRIFCEETRQGTKHLNQNC